MKKNKVLIIYIISILIVQFLVLINLKSIWPFVLSTYIINNLYYYSLIKKSKNKYVLYVISLTFAFLTMSISIIILLTLKYMFDFKEIETQIATLILIFTNIIVTFLSGKKIII